MSTIMPEGDGLRKAVKWISDNLIDHPDRSIQQLINEACLQFNLTPKDSEYLMNFYRKDK